MLNSVREPAAPFHNVYELRFQLRSNEFEIKSTRRCALMLRSSLNARDDSPLYVYRFVLSAKSHDRELRNVRPLLRVGQRGRPVTRALIFRSRLSPTRRIARFWSARSSFT